MSNLDESDFAGLPSRLLDIFLSVLEEPDY